MFYFGLKSTFTRRLTLTDKDVLVDDINDANAILVRSYKMHDLELPENVLAIARAGAGVNNIPFDK